ncbi:MAG: pyruvate dehydrogenase (acetyl-transferring) E1 component subunit alpha [Planctomycetota bacterium]|jgi:pyruvate dehydrogenase E1 component alpha subunit
MPSKTARSSQRSRPPGAAPAMESIPPHEADGRAPIDLGTIDDIQVLDERGQVVRPDIEPDLTEIELRRIYRAMVLTRKLDVRMLAMQRQGEMGTFAPGLGQEATQIGQIYPLRDTDWFVPSYRSFGAQLWRGWPIEQLLLLWDGFFEGFGPPEGVNDLPFSIVIGSHIPVATGIAMGVRTRGEDAVVMTNLGDGAMSQGVVNEAFNFAAVFKSPVVYMCENNGFAISMRTEKQSATPTLAQRGVGFGVPAVRVDGNDILGMIVATNRAVDHARAGRGPYLVEAVTYRMGVHTTADDPKVYRSDDEVALWEPKCPLRRFETYLKGRGLLDDETIERLGTECEQEVLAAREVFRQRAVPNAREVFDFMYEEMPPELAAQRDEYFRKLDRKGVE